jgi:alanyl-tRNA synthetase
VRNQLGARPGVVALLSSAEGKVNFVVATTSAARDKGIAAGKLVASFAPAIEARGGGKPDMAQGGGSNPAGVADAITGLRAEIARLAAG